jgi:hypothetical protein
MPHGKNSRSITILKKNKLQVRRLITGSSRQGNRNQTKPGGKEKEENKLSAGVKSINKKT